jgi:hypothetical protein
VFYKGLFGYKQVLMHEKYLPFVPHQYHTDDLYKKPSEEVLKSEKEDQDQIRKYKKMRRKDSKLHPYTPPAEPAPLLQKLLNLSVRAFHESLSLL